MEQLLIFLIGAVGYGTIELVWRGFTHWTMLITGGICFLMIYNLYDYFENTPPVLKAVLGCFVITAVEFCAGMLINIKFGLNVWNYSDLPMNLLGQICLPYSLLWFMLSFPLVFFCKWLSQLKILDAKKT